MANIHHLSKNFPLFYPFQQSDASFSTQINWFSVFEIKQLFLIPTNAAGHVEFSPTFSFVNSPGE